MCSPSLDQSGLARYSDMRAALLPRPFRERVGVRVLNQGGTTEVSFVLV